jgi:hypothetical protein
MNFILENESILSVRDHSFPSVRNIKSPTKSLVYEPGFLLGQLVNNTLNQFFSQGVRDENPNVNKKATLADTKSLLKVT